MPDVASRSDMKCASHSESEDDFPRGGEVRENASRRPDVTDTVVWESEPYPPEVSQNSPKRRRAKRNLKEIVK